jgi:hypothetical protein
LRERFMSQASFEAKAIIPSRDLLTAGTATAQLFEKNRGAYVSGAKAEALGTSYIAGLNTTELQGAGQRQRTAQQISEETKLRRTQAGKNGSAYDAMYGQLEASGYGAVSRGIIGMGAYMRDTIGGQTSNEAAAQVLELQRNDPVTGRDPEIVRGLDEMIAHLRSLDQKTPARRTPVNIDAHTE